MAVRTRRQPNRQVLNSEQAAWDFIANLSVYDEQNTPFPVLKGWASVEFKFWIEGQSIFMTAPVMQAMLDFQTALNRAYLLVREGNINLRSLSEEEREYFEALFKVSRGSTKLDINLQELAEKLGKEALGKMNSKQVATVIVSFALLFAGTVSWKAWLEEQREVAQMQTKSSETKALLDTQKFASEQDMKKYVMLNDTLAVVLKGNEMSKVAAEAKVSVVKAAAKVKSSRIAGTDMPSDVARAMTRSARTSSEEEVVTKHFDVLRVDTEVSHGFRVRLRDSSTGEEFFSDVRDRLLSENDRRLIQEGEWSKKPIEARVILTKHRGTITSALIAEVLGVVG